MEVLPILKMGIQDIQSMPILSMYIMVMFVKNL